VRLPLLFENREISKALSGGNETASAVRAVTGIDGMPFPLAPESMTFAELERTITAIHAEKYGN
jgi:hypothetical protein